MEAALTTEAWMTAEDAVRRDRSGATIESIFVSNPAVKEI